jgi:hypothetical protein
LAPIAIGIAWWRPARIAASGCSTSVTPSITEP